ncbi:MauE/DoxX family redox-associated membrane protein [Geobacter sp. FeAm09]|uniref:MauE/DoxX family redox-associated membrane protein n=1 Tax=Geobacter sp. FeAm09 TaxID=2597769 RepID=UPI00143DC6F5|nr:MauE/DoxX family redox-associated membrane protein [Geobacter sp. FeAm09]
MKTALRILLGLILLTASLAKLSNMSGFVAVLHSYRIFPPGLHWPAAIVVSGSELAVGSWLWWGRRLRQAAWTSSALHGVYACFAAFMLLRNVPILNCGCFGSYLARPLSWMTVGQNLVLVALSLLLVRLARPTASLYIR